MTVSPGARRLTAPAAPAELQAGASGFPGGVAPSSFPLWSGSPDHTHRPEIVMGSSITPCVEAATVHLELPPGAQATGEARQAAALMFASPAAACPCRIAEDIVLIVSELVTNAVLHANGPYALTLSLQEGRAGVAVSDASATLPRPRAGRQRLGPNGRGLRIIQALGADVFVSLSDRGKQVIAVLTW